MTPPEPPPRSGQGHGSGKVILLGEHAVVYGVPAIATSIDRGVRATATRVPLATVFVRGQELPRDHELQRALRSVLGRLGAPELRLDLELELPPGCGLGASAAMGVAVARAVLAVEGRELDDALVLDAVDGWERVFHGNPSGVDAAAALGNGVLQYVKGSPPRPLAAERPLRLALAVADPPASTREMVESVARLKARRPEVVERTLQGIRSLVRNAVLCIEAGDLTGLGSLMDYNHMLLSGLMLSTEGLEKACRVARSAGALGAKLTGAGGGGCVVALVEEDPEAVLAAWRSEGLECFAAEVAGERNR
jgi:mevalonate kinase